MEDTAGRNALISVRITELEKQAIQLRAEEEKSSQSDVAHRMMQRGNLGQLVAFYFGDSSSQITSELEEINETETA